jgi:hypothetical protein
MTGVTPGWWHWQGRRWALLQPTAAAALVQLVLLLGGEQLAKVDMGAAATKRTVVVLVQLVLLLGGEHWQGRRWALLQRAFVREAHEGPAR